MENLDTYMCEVCGKFITDEEGVTSIEGLWICDDDSCRTLDEESESIAKERRLRR